MAEKILGFQFLLIGIVGAALTHELTGANFVVSCLVGFVGGGAVFGGLMAFAPRVMFFGLVALYAAAGFSIARYFDWGVFETLVLTIAGGVVGWVGNVGFAQDMYFSQTPDDADAPPRSAATKPIKSVMAVEDKEELLDDAAIALASKLVSVPIYERMCKEIQKMASGQARADQPMTPDQIAKMTTGRMGDDDRMSIMNLSELHLIRADEWEAIALKLDGVDAPAAKPAPAASAPKKYDHVSDVDPADALFRLAEGRAISMETFLRGMLKVDPSYPPAAANLENFPESDLETEADIQAAALFEAKLIDLEEFQNAIAVIKGKPA